MTDVTRGPSVLARCEGCGLGYEVDVLGAAESEPVTECSGCGCPVYAVGLFDLVEMIEGCAACVAAGGECEFHQGFAAGWDACVAAVALAVERERLAELAGVEPPMFCMGYVPGDPAGCARCGECADAHGGPDLVGVVGVDGGV